jgi:hypothetical protein
LIAREVQSRYMQSTSSNSNDKRAASNKNQDGKTTAVGGNRPNIKPIKAVQKQLGISRPTGQKRKVEAFKFANQKLVQMNLNKNQGIYKHQNVLLF